MDPVIDPAIDDLAVRNLAGWSDAEGRLLLPRHEALQAGFAALNASQPFVVVLTIEGHRVTAWPKPFIALPGYSPRLAAATRAHFAFRAALYPELIRQALRRHPPTIATTLALDVSDAPFLDSREVPLFAFQKLAGSRNILLPDIDFAIWDWYRHQHDRLAYDDKAIRAGFTGASTGGLLTDALETPRLRMAAHFLGNPRVEFRIAQAVQYESAAARTQLRRQGYFGRRQSWNRQRRNRFLISIDGNGATCSRVALALKSNSVLLKFASPYELYYFERLVPGRDYLSVNSPADIEAVLDREEAYPGYYKPVAEAGAAFYARFLTRPSVLDYTAALIERYGKSDMLIWNSFRRVMTP